MSSYPLEGLAGPCVFLVSFSRTNCRDSVHGNTRLRITCDEPRSCSTDPRGADLDPLCISKRVDRRPDLCCGCVPVVSALPRVMEQHTSSLSLPVSLVCLS